MQKLATSLAASLSAVVLIGTLGTATPAFGAAHAPNDPAAEGKRYATDRKLGNCLACHMMGDGQSPGNIGPPLIAMQARFPDKAKLRQQVYDATIANPDSQMPPFGRHGILTDAQIDAIVEYLYTL